MKPTDICFLLECNEDSCLSRAIKLPLPNEFVILAWKASVGYSFPRARTQDAYHQISKKSISGL